MMGGYGNVKVFVNNNAPFGKKKKKKKRWENRKKTYILL